MSLEPLQQRVIFLAAAAIGQGEEPADVQEAIDDVVDDLVDGLEVTYPDEEPPIDLRPRVSATAPDLVDAVDVVQRASGEEGDRP